MSDTWPIESIDTLRRMWVAGASFSEIGRAIHKTRCAVAGKVRRLKLPSRGAEHFRQQAAKAARARWGDRPDKPKTTRHFSLRRTNPKTRKPPMHLRVVSVPESKPVPLMERTGCCYPVTSTGPHLFCDLPTSRGDYCAAHFKAMYPRGRHDTRNFDTR